MKGYIYLTLALALSLSGGGTLLHLWQKAKADKNRVEANFNTLAGEYQNYKAGEAVRSKALSMQVSEIKEAFPAMEQRIKNELGVKLRNVASITNTVTEVNHTFKTTVKDSVKLDTIPIQTVAYRDAWLNFQADIVNHEMSVNQNQITDTLLQVVHRQRQPGFWGLFKKRILVQDLKASNPNMTIKFSRYIQVD